MALAFETAINLAAKIKSGALSATELTDYFIGRIEKFDDKLNAVVIRDFDRARDAARQADEQQARGEALGPLHGVPMTIKESYNIEGLKTSWGIEPFKDNVATSDAIYVQKMKQAGAIFLGKTNIPVNLADFQSYNPIYGTTNNPWNLERTPGGSSGGSAAALAAGFSGLDAGSDIGGSIRNPAHFCGVFGHKPTYGVVPWQGHELPGMSKMADIAVVGPLARSAEDLALSMDLVCAPEPVNAPGWRIDLPRPDKQSLKDYRVAIWMNEEDFPVSQEVMDRMQMVADVLARQGATVSEVARPEIDPRNAYETYLYLLQGALSSSIPEDQFAEMKAMANQIPDEDRSIGGLMMKGAAMDHRQWNGLNNHRETLRLAWQSFFNSWDIVIAPIMPTAAFPHDQSDVNTRKINIDNHQVDYFEQIFWAGLTGVSYLPSTVFPTGPSKDGLPIGLQAIGGEYFDYQCIDFSRLLAEQIGGFVAPKGYED